MRSLKSFALGLALHGPLCVLAAASPPAANERALREECSAFSQAGMRDCLAHKAESSQRALKKAEKSAAAALSRWDEDSRYRQQAQARLAASQKAFVQYRDAQCRFAYSLGSGAIGNALEMRRLACLAELNGGQASRLDDALSDLPLK